MAYYLIELARLKFEILEQEIFENVLMKVELTDQFNSEKSKKR